tara:strand:- start:879 stop:1220 length:342 start_codon:yes stop_codon:yes gene_type:complete
MEKNYRPWGFYENILVESNYLIKKITILPSSRLSLQSHSYRSEYWIVIKGKGKYVVGDNKFDFSEGNSIFIPQNVKHRLINDSSTNIEIIEIQKGEKISEDDIIRYQDDYKRN